MKTQQIFTIGTPCHEDWNKMTPTDKGRFCDSCAKCVVDLSGKSQSEIKDLYVEHAGNLCGSMPKTQFAATEVLIQRDRPAVRRKQGMAFMRKMQIFAAALIAIFSSFWTSKAEAQSPLRGKVAHFAHRSNVSGTVSLYGKGIKARIVAQKGAEVHRTESDENGFYRFSNLSNGVWDISAFSEDGVEGASRKYIEENTNETVNIKMFEIMELGDIDYFERGVPEPIEPKEVELPDVEMTKGEVKVSNNDSVTCQTTGPQILGGISFTEVVEPSRIEVVQDGSTKDPSDPAKTESAESPLVSTIKLSLEVLVKPIPSSDEITIQVEKGISEDRIELLLFTADGKLVQTGVLSGATGSATTMDIRSLSSGIYFLKGLQDEYVFEKKILKL